MTIKVYFTEDKPAVFQRWTPYATLDDWSQLASLSPATRVGVLVLPAGLSFAVCAPAGFGKSTRAQDILRALGLPDTTPVVHEWAWDTPRTPGALHLTNEDPRQHVRGAGGVGARLGVRMNKNFTEAEVAELARIGECSLRCERDVKARQQKVMTPPGEYMTFYLIESGRGTTYQRGWRCEGLDPDGELGEGATPMAAYMSYLRGGVETATRTLARARAEPARIGSPVTAPTLKVQVAHAPNGTGLNWFVDVWRAGGWDHHASFRTKDEAEECARQLRRGGAC